MSRLPQPSPREAPPTPSWVAQLARRDIPGRDANIPDTRHIPRPGDRTTPAARETHVGRTLLHPCTEGRSGVDAGSNCRRLRQQSNPDLNRGPPAAAGTPAPQQSSSTSAGVHVACPRHLEAEARYSRGARRAWGTKSSFKGARTGVGVVETSTWTAAMPTAPVEDNRTTAQRLRQQATCCLAVGALRLVGHGPFRTGGTVGTRGFRVHPPRGVGGPGPCLAVEGAGGAAAPLLVALATLPPHLRATFLRSRLPGVEVGGG